MGVQTEIEIDLHVLLMSAQEQFQYDSIGFRDPDVRFHIGDRGEARDECSIEARGLRRCHSSEIIFEECLRLREVRDGVLVEFCCTVATITQALNMQEIVVRYVGRGAEVREWEETVAIADFIAKEVIRVVAETNENSRESAQERNYLSNFSRCSISSAFKHRCIAVLMAKCPLISSNSCS